MKKRRKTDFSKIMRDTNLLGSGRVGVIPTDTIYGIVGSALDKKVVERIYRLRKRDPKKPMIILIGDICALRLFGIKIDHKMEDALNNVWPGKVSVILPCQSKSFYYLHRGTKTLAFRLPKPLLLRRFLWKTGPLVAPSANINGMPPSKTIAEAKRYFTDGVDFYVNVGSIHSKPSKIIKIEHGKINVVRV